MPICFLCRPAVAGDIPCMPERMRMGGRLVKHGAFSEIFFFYARGVDDVGAPHHESIEALVESAKTCPLCDLVHERLQSFIAAYKAKDDDPDFRKIYARQGIPDLIQLRVAKCVEGGDRFYIVMYSSDRSRIYAIAEIAFCADEGTPLAEKYLSRRIDPDASHEVSLNRVSNWVNGCVLNHTCGMTGDVSLPSRLLDLSGKSSIRLCETRGQHGRYAALSHCWGQTRIITTTQATLQDRLALIPIESLSRTFQDAVLVARHLGLQYLWIDSLCICQDDLTEWAQEAALMSEVYAQAYVVISADGAPNGTHGMLGRSPSRYAPVHEDGHAPYYAFDFRPAYGILERLHLELKDQPLTERAWVLQERSLPRRIIHFTSRQTCFECVQEFVNEDGYKVTGRLSTVYDDLSKPTFPRRERNSIYSLAHSAWYQMLEEYTGRNVTNPNDKLPAISGLAKHFETRLGAKYVAGLWSDSLIEGLCWQTVNNQRKGPPLPRTQYIAPTWSWAGCSDMVAGGSPETTWKEVAQVESYHVELKTVNPYGEVSDGWIRLRAPLLQLALSNLPEEDTDTLELPRQMRLHTPNGNPFGMYCYFDGMYRQNEESHAWAHGQDLWALVLIRQDPAEGDFFGALIVRPVKNHPVSLDPPIMERLGWIYLHDIDEEMKPRIQSITLV